MMCKLCRSYPCHPLCPNYMPPHSEKKCIICGEYINVGEEYVENYEGVAAARGRIYDRNGVLLAYNDLSYAVKISDSGRYSDNARW
mgnify:CR=1 FL=1